MPAPAAKVVAPTNDDPLEAALLPATRNELMLARKATAKYGDISQALAEGYVDINVFIPHMGFHYLKAENLDGEFDPERPELLVYAQDLWERQMRLVAIEYAVPTNLASVAPEGFTGDADQCIEHQNSERR